MESDVLVVDDSVAIRKLLRRVLQTAMPTHTIHEAGDGQEALTLLQAQNVDLILSDINMPKMDGLQFLASLKASSQWRHIPVVMISTEWDNTRVSDAVMLGAAGYIRKPFKVDQVREKVARILRSGSAGMNLPEAIPTASA
jgi:two-component system chemotaxis response regulator CheY